MQGLAPGFAAGAESVQAESLAVLVRLGVVELVQAVVGVVSPQLDVSFNYPRLLK